MKKIKLFDYQEDMVKRVQEAFIPRLTNRPLRQWEIVADDNICVINNTYLIEKSEPDQWYKICKRTDDFSYLSLYTTCDKNA